MPTSNPHPSDPRRIAAWTLGSVMVGHVLLETGVDATFLAHVSVDRLPLMTIVVAFLALGLARLGDGHQHRTVLIALQGIGALGTVVLWSLASTSLSWSYYALFIWSGVIGSLVIVRIWLLLGDLFTISEAKRAFATIAMGGAIGALIGSGIGALLAPLIGGEGLLLAAAGGYGLSVCGSVLLPSAERTTSRSAEEQTGLRTSFRSLMSSPYAFRIALLVVAGGITLTLGDFLFKSVLTEEVSPDQLAVWLSRISLGLNFLSILLLAVGVTPLVRWLGVDRSLVVMPALMAGAALGVIAGAAMAATVFMKTADGTLRYSLHKTASELLYIPMTSSLRTSVKAAIDIVGQTGAKAAASVMILGLLLLPSPRLTLSIAIVLVSVVWIAMALRLRQSYLDMFRNTLSDGSIETMVDYPELDLESVGTWIQALSDPDKNRSIAAMRLLAERGREQLIPNLIVYHPAPEVVAHALDLFAANGRRDLSHLLDRLVEHEYAEVRAASVRAKWSIEKDFDGLHQLAEASCPVVRISALAGLLAAGEIESSALVETLDIVSNDQWCASRMAAATAARLYYDPVYRKPLLHMLTDDDTGVAREAIRAIRESQDPWFIPELVRKLGSRAARPEIRGALLNYSDASLSVLASSLVDPEVPDAIRVHIPRTIAHFERPKAASVLLDSLQHVESGMIRFKILRGLESLMRLSVDMQGTRRDALKRDEVAVVKAEFDRTLASTRTRLSLEVELEKWQQHDATKATPGGELLVDIFRDKRSLAAGRLFMMLGLIFSADDFRAIQTGLLAEDKRDRASARELLETLLPAEVAGDLIELTTLRPGNGRESGNRVAAAPPSSYERLVSMTIENGSDSLGAVALYHAAELGMESVVMPADRESSAAEHDAGTAGLDRGIAAVQDFLDRHANPQSPVAR